MASLNKGKQGHLFWMGNEYSKVRGGYSLAKAQLENVLPHILQVTVICLSSFWRDLSIKNKAEVVGIALVVRLGPVQGGW